MSRSAHWMRSPFTPGLRLAAACLALAVSASALALTAQETSVADPCDPKLVRPAKDPLGYGRRGERCEGVYVQEVAGSAGLLVASLTEAFEQFDIAPGDKLRLGWSAVGAPAVRLRAVALRRRLYYRMDTERPRGSTMFEWPTDVLASLKIGPQEIGLVGWTQQQVGDRTEDVYLPLRVGKHELARTGRYIVLVVPGSELSELYVTLAEVGPNGNDAVVLKRGEALKYGFYPAERRIRVELPPLERSGIYRLEFGATLSRGAATTKSLLFYHAGR